MNEKGLVLVVIDGLTPSVFERAVEAGEAPALAFVPALGYAEAALVPLLAVRASRRGSSRYAGLRILAKD